MHAWLLPKSAAVIEGSLLGMEKRLLVIPRSQNDHNNKKNNPLLTNFQLLPQFANRHHLKRRKKGLTKRPLASWQKILS
jgi:hypothetical protein